MRYTVAGIGGANVDVHGKSAQPIVLRDSNPGALHLSVGGVCRNVCDNLCRLGESVTFLGAVGEDAFGAMLLGSFRALGMDTAHLAVLPGKRTSSYVSLLDSEGDMLAAMSDMSIVKELDASFVAARMPAFAQARACVADANLSFEALSYLASHCPVPIMFDPVSTAWAKAAAPLAGAFHTLKPNLLELEALTGLRVTGDASLKAACGALLKSGAKQIYVSLGKDGVWYQNSGGLSLYKKSRPFPVRNATGAGDATMAGIVYAWLHGLSPDDSLNFALGAALAALGSENTINSEMSKALVLRMIKEYIA